ncbi:hypothetical protein G6Z34_13790 [Clostridium perfringens]|uniref:Uncharacterized protein n=1 Tax=Clostridium perfringens TaxID=1502 RepID=A0AAP6WQB7_CLOPF|nr:hypothetical protein [Clostridium perfringens]NGU31157.1 hypothetical protein [Clostridium perfringens]
MLNNLNKKELLELIDAYDDYIQYVNDGELYNKGWKPVCIEEFYNDDFEAWKEN